MLRRIDNDAIKQPAAVQMWLPTSQPASASLKGVHCQALCRCKPSTWVTCAHARAVLDPATLPAALMSTAQARFLAGLGGPDDMLDACAPSMGPPQQHAHTWGFVNELQSVVVSSEHRLNRLELVEEHEVDRQARGILVTLRHCSDGATVATCAMCEPQLPPCTHVQSALFNSALVDCSMLPALSVDALVSACLPPPAPPPLPTHKRLLHQPAF